jgi:hypothetical protein
MELCATPPKNEGQHGARAPGGSTTCIGVGRIGSGVPPSGDGRGRGRGEDIWGVARLEDAWEFWCVAS